jgi:EpsI family protein
MRLNRIHIALASLAMLVTAAAAELLAPRQSVGVVAPNLSVMIPRQFGAWSYVASIGLVTPPPDPETAEDAGRAASRYPDPYSQVVGRGYQDALGHIVMLLVAYGPAQDYKLKAHRPEFCYVAAGFRILDKSEAALRIDHRPEPLRMTRLVAERESRLEPVSYWMRVGDEISHGAVDRQLIRFKYGLRGITPDGALIRVSTVGLEPDASFRIQDQFIRDLLAAMTPEELPFFVGKGT